MLKNWLSIFLFHTKKNKLFTALNILGLSIGIAGLIFAILYWNDEHSYNAWNPEKDKVHQLVTIIDKDNIWDTTVSPLEPFVKEMPEVASHCYFGNGYENKIVSYNGKKEFVEKIISAQNTFFSFFPFRFIEGTPKTALAGQNSIALSAAAAKRLFGNDSALGKSVQYGRDTYAVRGVYAIDDKSSMAPEAVVNTIDADLLKLNSWENFNFGLLLKLKDPSQKEIVQNKIAKIFYENKVVPNAKEAGVSVEEYVKRNGQAAYLLEPLATARLHSITDGYPEGKGNYQSLLIMAGLSVLILLLSIVNYVNLATVNAARRAKEVGVRKIAGASKKDIIRQFLFETVITVLFAILLSLVIVELSLPYYNDFLGKELQMSGSQFYLALLAVFAITVLFAGIFPSVYVSNFETLKVLKGNFGRSKSGVWFRNGMLVMQFAIAAFFIIGSYIVQQQVNYISTKDLGFNGDQVIVVSFRPIFDLDDPAAAKKGFLRYNRIISELSKIKGVKQATTGAFTFGGSSTMSSDFNYNNTSIMTKIMGTDFGMLEMMKIKLKEGRPLEAKFSSDTINSMLVNETALRMMNEKKPIGKEVECLGKKLRIIGVVKDFHVNGPDKEITPMVFFHLKTVDWMIYNVNKIYVKVEPENMEEAIAGIEKLWVSKVDTEYPFKYDFVDKSYARSYASFVKQKNLFSLLNIVVILIALFGLFALASYSIQSRMKEIAIRKTLGAPTGMMLQNLSKQYILFCLAGFAIALLPAYYLLEKWLENFAYRITISVVPFIIGFFILLLLTLAIVLARAYQATRVNVLKYLKYE
ncbi:MAG TPA: ABC transporter permease [Flavobacterium sp.]|nr:ABC transporter permease [Flavobacterium sp.]